MPLWITVQRDGLPWKITVIPKAHEDPKSFEKKWKSYKIGISPIVPYRHPKA